MWETNVRIAVVNLKGGVGKTTIDPDGNVVVFTAARPPDRSDPAFNEQMRRWNLEQGVEASPVP